MAARESHTEVNALSRAPADDPAPEDSIADSQIQSDLHPILTANRLEVESDIQLVELAQLAENNEEYTQLCEIILDGFPHQKSDLPVLVRDKLAVDDHLVLCVCHLIIPRQMRLRTQDSGLRTQEWFIQNKIHNDTFSNHCMFP